MTANEKGLIDYLVKNGKRSTDPWITLAKQFGYTSEHSARMAWFEYRKTNANKIISSITANNTDDSIKIETLAEKIEKDSYISELEAEITKYEEDFKTGKASIEATVGQEIKTLDELIEKTKIDLTKWKITKWTQNFWNNKYQVKVNLEPISLIGEENFRKEFTEFLKEYKAPEPVESPATATYSGLPSTCLIINKQDAHLNKMDVDGDNDINKRFDRFYDAVDVVINKARATSNLEDILYVIGSDQFNSEFTGCTTKGTPQQNILTYHEAFKAICDHEVKVITRMIQSGAKVDVMYLAGNHDEYIGWHLITWLEAWFKESKVGFDSSEDYTKVISYGNSSMLFNHGAEVKIEQLAGVFPKLDKDFSGSDYHYVFTGDKHHMSAKDINGVECYQLPALSTSSSYWDKRRVFLSNNGLQAFVITENSGMSDIYKIPFV